MKKDTAPREKIEKFEILIGMVNETTKVNIREGKRYISGEERRNKELAPSEKYLIHFVEVQNIGMVLEIPTKSCAVGHNLSLEIATKGFKQNVHFHAGAKVLEVDKGEDHDRVAVEFFKYDKLSWTILLGEMKNRQEAVTRLFESMRDK